MTAGGEFVQESTPRGVRYVYEDTGQSLGYQTTEGLAAINPHPYGPPQLIYSTVTHGGEVTQFTTKPGDVHYVANDGRVLGKETPEGLVRVSKGIFDPAPPDVDAAGIPSARPQRVENPDAPDAPDAPRPVQVATPQPVPDPDAVRYMSVDPDGMPLAWNPDGTLNYEANIRFSTDAGKQLLYTVPVVGTGLTVYDASRDGQWTNREMVMTGLSAAGDMLLLTPGKYLSAVGGAVVRGGRFTHTRMFAQDAPWSDAIKMARGDGPTHNQPMLLAPPGTPPIIVGLTDNPNVVMAMHATPKGFVIGPENYPWRSLFNRGESGVDDVASGGGRLGPGGGGPGGGATATYRSQRGELLDVHGNVIPEAPHPTSFVATEGAKAFTTTASGLAVPPTAVVATATAMQAAPALTPTPITEVPTKPESAPQVVPTQPQRSPTLVQHVGVHAPPAQEVSQQPSLAARAIPST